MTILNTPLYTEQLKKFLTELAQEDLKEAKDFKLYLDTVIINIATKVQKYKPSIYFDNPQIKDVEFRGLTIPFYYEEASQTYVILAIFERLKENG